jgi:hypothetical protein
MADETPRTYSGRNVGLAIVAVTLVVFGALNLVGRATRDRGHRETPAPAVTYVTP